MARPKKKKTDWVAIANLIKGMDRKVLLESISDLDGHSLYKPQKFSKLPPEVVEAFTETIESDTSDPKTTIFNDRGEALAYVHGIYGLRLVEFIAQTFGITSWKLGRGSRYYHLLEQLQETLKG